MNPHWLEHAVLYQIYPQSFHDSNADGIGDLPGITAKLDYLQWLGVTAIWISPCFDSPFHDAGYDISDYTSIAERYGTSDDLRHLTEAAHQRGIRVLLDLVIGHTSEQHPWFRTAVDDPDDHRYIWASEPAPAFVASPGRRPGYYLRNFLDCQPALNFGYARTHPDQPWRQPPDAPAAQHNRNAIREIMTHWLEHGVDGFRCDMAYSLVKDDPEHTATAQLWGQVRQWLDRTYPDAVLLAEWGHPQLSVPAGFHADFFLQFNGDAMRSLWDNGAGVIRADTHPINCYFDPAGRGSPDTFLTDWTRALTAINGRGHVILPSSNHDFSRLAAGRTETAQLKAAFALLATWPTIPAIYYGDEIGMRYVHHLPNVEGSQLGPANNRAGSRTPMQWDDSTNSGFSAAAPGRLYLPLDPDPRRPTVAEQRKNPESLLNTVRDLLRLRHDHLRGAGVVTILHQGYPLTYLRGQQYLITINPSGSPKEHPLPAGPWKALLDNNARIDGGQLRVDGHGYGVFQRDNNERHTPDE